ncbi:PHP domain-containing protein [Clostridiaceae bacterium M8S5]|nr:PHP domain-containing protein [Clostridiaceae bacterium M8S5]
MADEKTADLHIHSLYSDGTKSPKEILDTAIQNGVGLLAIADHNVLDGTRQLKELCTEKGVKSIVAVELDSLDKGIDIHILGYGVDLNNKEFCDFVKENRRLLDEISIKLIRKLEEYYDNITLDDFMEYDYDSRKGGWKALHYFMDKGLTDSLVDGFVLYTDYGCFYDSVEFHSVKEVCEFIHKAGGKAVLAHPGVRIIETDMSIFKKELLRLVSLGLDGIECYYPKHTEAVTNACLETCVQNNLIITAGSDFHGSFGNTDIGQMSIPINKLNLEGINID